MESTTKYTCYGGARGGGKTWAIRVKAVCGAVQYPGIKILIVRKRYEDLLGNHIDPIRQLVPGEIGEYRDSTRTMYFQNGSTIRFGNWQSATAEGKYRGQEFDWIFIDEATQFTETEFRTLAACMRGVNNFPKRFYLSCNPGGIGHRWVKRLFIDRDFKVYPNEPERNENPNDYLFIPATVEDNTALMESEGGAAYLEQLSQMPEAMRLAHRYGDWNALGGVYFDEFRLEYHTQRPFLIPDTWARYRAFDYGLDMFACYWIAVDPDGRCYVYREYCKSGLIAKDAARAILEHTMPNENVSITFAPPDIWSRQKDSGKSSAEIFMLNGIGLVKASNNRIQGHMQIKHLLSPGEDGKPGLIIFDSCKRLIDDLQCIQADEADPNDCAKQPHDCTHTVDGLRYFCISRVIPGEAGNTAEENDYEDYEDIEDYDAFMCGGELSMSYLSY